MKIKSFNMKIYLIRIHGIQLKKVITITYGNMFLEIKSYMIRQVFILTDNVPPFIHNPDSVRLFVVFIMKFLFFSKPHTCAPY